MSKLPILSPDDKTPATKSPKTLWDTIISSTPIVMTVVATVLAGLSSSEMGRAQYFASIAAQQQSKVGDQWNFFQAKRLKAAAVDNTLAQPILMGKANAAPLDPAELSRGSEKLASQLKAAQAAAAKISDSPTADALGKTLATAADEAAQLSHEFAKAIADPSVAQAMTYLAAHQLPPVNTQEITNPDIHTAIDRLEKNDPAAADPQLLKKITDADLLAAMHRVDENAAAFDAATKPVGKAVAKAQSLLANLGELTTAAMRQAPAAGESADLRALGNLIENAASNAAWLNADLATAVLRYDSARYNQESTINLLAARLIEIQVRKTNLSVERHRVRSGYFFYGMLGAQAAVTLASLALAVKERSLFWSIATVLGGSAIAFAGYVYLFK